MRCLLLLALVCAATAATPAQGSAARALAPKRHAEHNKKMSTHQRFVRVAAKEAKLHPQRAAKLIKRQQTQLRRLSRAHNLHSEPPAVPARNDPHDSKLTIDSCDPLDLNSELCGGNHSKANGSIPFQRQDVDPSATNATNGTDTDEDTDISLDPNGGAFPGCSPNNASYPCPEGAGDGDVIDGSDGSDDAGDPVDPLDTGTAAQPSPPPPASQQQASIKADEEPIAGDAGDPVDPLDTGTAAQPSPPPPASQQMIAAADEDPNGDDTDEDTDISLDPNGGAFPGCSPNNASYPCPEGAGDGDVIDGSDGSDDAGDPVDPLDTGVAAQPSPPPSPPATATSLSAEQTKGTPLEGVTARARRLREKRDAARKAEAARLRRKKAKVHAKLNSLRGKDTAKGGGAAKHVSKPHVAPAAKRRANLVAAESTGNKNQNVARFAAQPVAMLLGGDSSTKVFDTDESDTY